MNAGNRLSGGEGDIKAMLGGAAHDLQLVFPRLELLQLDSLFAGREDVQVQPPESRGDGLANLGADLIATRWVGHAFPLFAVGLACVIGNSGNVAKSPRAEDCTITISTPGWSTDHVAASVAHRLW